MSPFAVVLYLLCETCYLLTRVQHPYVSLWNAGVTHSQTVLLKLSPENPPGESPFVLECKRI